MTGYAVFFCFVLFTPPNSVLLGSVSFPNEETGIGYGVVGVYFVAAEAASVATINARFTDAAHVSVALCGRRKRVN